MTAKRAISAQLTAIAAIALMFAAAGCGNSSSSNSNKTSESGPGQLSAPNAAAVQIPPGSSGTPDYRWYSANPNAARFTVSTADELASLARIVNGTWGRNPEYDDFYDKTVTLAANIDLSPYDNWEPIGVSDLKTDVGIPIKRPFSGAFDGGGHVVRNLTINRADKDYLGLFGEVTTSGGRVENLGIESANITGRNYVGALAGSVDGRSAVKNCYSTGTINALGRAGGLVGELNGAISSSYSACNVAGQDRPKMWENRFIGGVVGQLHGSITNCYSTGAVSGGLYAGGVVGSMYDGSIVNSYSTGEARAREGAGGIVGYLSTGTLTNSYSTGAISGDTGVGGVAGLILLGGRATSCFATGLVKGVDKVGGIAGEVSTGGKITHCIAYNKGVQGNGDRVGRITGSFDGGEGSRESSVLAENGAYYLVGDYGRIFWHRKLDGIDGMDFAPSAETIGSVYGRFTTENGWTIEHGKLPGLGGRAVEIPAHLKGI